MAEKQTPTTEPRPTRVFRRVSPDIPGTTQEQARENFQRYRDAVQEMEEAQSRAWSNSDNVAKHFIGNVVPYLDREHWETLTLAKEADALYRKGGFNEDPALREQRYADRQKMFDEVMGREVTGATLDEVAEAKIDQRERLASITDAAKAEAESGRADVRARIQAQLNAGHQRAVTRTRLGASERVAPVESREQKQASDFWAAAEDNTLAQKHALAAEMGKMFEDKGRLSEEDLSSFAGKAERLGVSPERLKTYADNLNVKARRGIADEMIGLAKKGNLTFDSMTELAEKGKRYGLTQADISAFAKKNMLSPRDISRDASLMARNEGSLGAGRTDGSQVSSDQNAYDRQIRRYLRMGSNVPADLVGRAAQAGIENTGIQDRNARIADDRRERAKRDAAVDLEEESLKLASAL